MSDPVPAAAAGSVARSTLVPAPAARVWALVSDLPGMGRFSPENTGGRWVRGGGPVVGAVFRGRNANGRRRWATRCVVTQAEPGRAFAFDVAYLRLPVATWRYVLEPQAEGCRVTESWSDRRGWLLRTFAGLATGVGDREAFTARSIEATLSALRKAAERGAGHPSGGQESA